MSPILPPPSGLRSLEGLVIFSPPQVSLRQGSVAIDAQAVRREMEKLPSGVRAAAFSLSPPTSPQELEVLRTMGDLLLAGVDAVASVRSVSEAVKAVDDGWVVGSLDRSAVVSVTFPILVDRSVLAALFSEAAQASIDPIQEIIGAGGSVRVVSQPD